MRIKFVLLFIIISFTIFNCNNENNSPYYILVEGNWQGTINGDTLFITFIEGMFENFPTVSGAAHITNDSQTVAYQIMNGTHNQVETVWFALYEIPVEGKEDYEFVGNIVGSTIEGTFSQFDSISTVIRTGFWEVGRVP